MADIHVTTGNRNNEWLIVMHIPIPSVINAVGVNYRTALLNSGIGGSTTLLDGDGNNGTIGAAEKTQIENGELFEHIVPFRVESGGISAGQLQTAIRELFTQNKSGKLEELQTRLRYFGHTESES